MPCVNHVFSSAAHVEWVVAKEGTLVARVRVVFRVSLRNLYVKGTKTQLFLAFLNDFFGWRGGCACSGLDNGLVNPSVEATLAAGLFTASPGRAVWALAGSHTGAIT